MKKLIILSALLLCLAVLGAVDVIIGTGTASNLYYDYPAVYGGWYKNAREQYLVTAGEFAANGGGAGDITSLAFNVYAVNGCGPLPNFTIRMGHTAVSVLSTTFETGLTQVYTNASYQPVVGLNTHVFDTAFPWNGTSNVVIEVTFDMQTAYTENTSTYYSVTPGYMANYYRSDSTAWNTVTTGTLSYNRPNMRFNMPAGGAVAPFPANLVSPPNGGLYVPLTATLNWSSGGGNPTQYKVYFGTSATPPLVATVDASVTTYDPELAYDTPYYWQIIPTNAQGDATGCPVWSFTTTQEGTVQIGSGTDVSPLLPIYAFYGYTYSQVIYHQAQIGGACMINSLAYYWNGAAASTVSNDWVVYMGHTANNAFASTTDWLPLGSLTQVFAGNVDMAATPGWITITLPVPFFYNGTDNLVIAVEENEAGYDSPYGQFYCTTTPEVRGLLYYSDTTNPDPATPPTAMYMRSALANVLMQTSEITASAPAAPILDSPTNGQTLIPLAGVDLEWHPDLVNGGMPDYYAVYLSPTEEDIYGSLYFETTATTANTATDLGASFAYNEDWYWTVEAINDWNNDDVPDTAVADPPNRFDVTPAPPQISVVPTSLTETLENGETNTQQLTISNAGELPLNYSMGFTDTTTRGSLIIPPDQMPQLIANPNASQYSERAPFIGPLTEAETRTIFDVQFYYNTFMNNGEYGVATDGNYFYTSNWGYGGNGVMNKYALDGTHLSTFTIAGVPGIRDLAYDGTYFYGGAASTTIYIMDFTAQTLVGTVPAPVAVRGIAYDPDSDALWVGNQWAADIRKIDRATGTQISSLVPAIASFAGIAYDNLSGPTPTLWGNTENGTTGNLVAQIDIATGAVLQSLDVTDTQIPGLAASLASCGGIEIFPNLVPGTATILCNAQNFAFYGLELCDVASWVSADPRQGTVPAGGSQVVDVLFDATGLNPGVYTGNFTISHNAPTAAVDVPVQLTVTGVWPAEFSLDPTSHNFGDVEQLNPASTTFTVTNTGGSVPAPLTISSVYITDDAEGNFSAAAPGLPVDLDHNETYDVTVTFTPQTLGAKTATLNIVDNLTRTVHTATLSGNGIAEEILQVANLQAVVQNNEDVHLSWILASTTPGQPGWIHYDDGTNYDSIGAGGPANFDVAIKFPSAVMYPYNGMQLENIKFWPNSSHTNFILKIWTGLDASVGPATLVYSQPLATVTVAAWNDITLTTPYTINGTEALWFGYNCDVLDNALGEWWPAGCDAGPAVVNYGDLIYFGGTWSSMYTAYGLNYNWNLQGYVDNATLRGGAPQLSIPVIESPDKEYLRNHTLATASGETTSRVLRGYNVYRDNTTTPINPTLIPTTSYVDYGVPIGTYDYYVQGVYYSGVTNMAGPVEVVITPPVPYELPFAEAWDSGLYATQQWATSATNWYIDTYTGDPTPCAAFSWSPQITNYETYLTSWWLNGVGQTNVNVSFELSLNNYSTDAENWMALEVWNGSTWNTVQSWSSFDNAGEGWGFIYYNFDISAYADGNLFKIRFKTTGEDSYEINQWYIDNIYVSALPATLPAPVCTITPDDPDVLVTWDEVPGATWYGVYAATDPYGTYTYLGWLPASYIGVYFTAGNYEFFEVTAGVGNLPRGRMLDRGIEQ